MLTYVHGTCVNIDATAHEDRKRLAVELSTTFSHTVTLPVRALRQDRIGDDLRTDLRIDEVDWLDAGIG